MFSYRVGLPLWKVAARLGAPVHVRIEILRDEEANVYIATSPDVRGLVVEAEDFETLHHEISDGLNMLLEGDLPKREDHLSLVFPAKFA